MLDRRNLKQFTQRVSVYTRHTSSCAHVGHPHHKRCDCFKYLCLMADGGSKTLSAKTRSWSVAEVKAAALRDSLDPLKQRLAELEGNKQAQDAEAVTVESALERWLASIRNKHDNDNTYSKYRTVAKYIGLWARLKGLARLQDISADHLDAWKDSWTTTAKRPEDRIGKTTAARRLEMVKRFTKYCLRMAWIGMDPAADFDAITPDLSETMPLLSGRYEAVIAATYQYDAQMRPDDRFGPELRAIIELMRWSGLRIGDALKVRRADFKGNRLTIKKSQKTKKPHAVIVPDHVIAALFNLAKRPTIDLAYFFWSGKSLHKSLTSQWQRKLQRLNDYLSMIDDEGHPMRFHSHQLRDTFAVEHLLAGTTMQDLSRMLTHRSIKVTEKYYAPWVPERQAALELKMIEALGKMGAGVTLSAGKAAGVPG